MRTGLVPVSLLLTAAVPLAQAEHPDPPMPPHVVEKVTLHTLTLKVDEDDGINFETEIFIKITTVKAGHDTKVFLYSVEDIDMDPPNETSYTVIDGTETAPERKGSEIGIYFHDECTPIDPIDITIEVFEINSTNVGAIIEKLGKSFGNDPALLAALGVGTSGAVFIGPVASIVGTAIDEIGNNEDSLGFGTYSVPLGVSALHSPTASYDFKTNYTQRSVDDTDCPDTEEEGASDALDDPGTTDEDEISWYGDVEDGLSADHPFTKNYATFLIRRFHATDALSLVDSVGVESGETHPDIAGMRDTLREAILDVAREALETELLEASANGVGPGPIASANAFLSQGLAQQAAQQYSLGLQSYLDGIDVLLLLNHAGPIPTLPSGGLFVLALALVGAASLLLRRRKRRAPVSAA